MLVISKTGYFKKRSGYRITFIQSSDLYFLSIHANLLELDHQCVHMWCLRCNETNSFIHYLYFRNVALSYSELLMIIKSRVYNVFKRILAIFLLHYEPKWLWNWKQFLAHLSQRLEWAIAVRFRPSSVVRSPSSVNFLHFHLLLENAWLDFNQTWQESSLGVGDSKLFK